jgi:hypothetical protein
MGKCNTVDLDLIRKHLIKTWQPVSAIAYHAEIPVKTALKGLLILEENGEAKKSRVRIDGHNEVHLFKKLEYTKVFGVVVPIDTNGQEV